MVGIGASAGGLEAFKRLLAAIPEKSGMAYVLVQHLDPTHESILPALLQRITRIPVLEITDDIPLAPDHIYVIPSNKMLLSTDGILKLTDREEKINFSIDVFFTSLAKVHKELAIGVVLSGTGSDGTLGLKAIKEHGGICIAQDAESAAFDGMPQNAMNSGIVDFVLAPEHIPAQLLLIKNGIKTAVFDHEQEADAVLPKDDAEVFKEILLLLRQRSGVDFSNYKQPTFQRRIARRINIVKKKNSTDYLHFLRTNNAEQDALFFDVLIPVTSFFRDPKTFHALTQNVFPTILKNKYSYDPIRIWIAGCSTGQEAFSIAICLHEYLTLTDAKGEDYFSNATLANRQAIQIFASDISEKAIKKARTAKYSKAEVEKLSETQINTYFVKKSGDYEIKKIIRDMCVFAPHNFLKDPPFAKLDLVTCRNVLIYMNPFLQKKAFTTFHYALKDNGFLLLGKSETPGASSDLFAQVIKNEKIYSRKSLPGRFLQLAPQSPEGELEKSSTHLSKTKTIALEAMEYDFRKSAEAVMILKSPASVVVNEQMDIVHFYGDITPFLQAPEGKPTHNLIKMAREGLAFELRNIFHKASKEKAAVLKENIPITENAGLGSDKAHRKQALVTIEIIPLKNTIETYYLIRFEKKLSANELAENSSVSGKINTIQLHNQQLAKELLQSRVDMRYLTEDMEAANEELQSANEEMQSSNEEMQSLNEELETSKEELQSTNEELIIVNQEMHERQEQLNAAYAQKVNALKQLEVSEAFNLAIIDSSPDCLKILDREGRIQFMNFNGLCQMEIDDFSTFKNQYWWTLWGSENQAMVKSAVNKALKGESARFTALCCTANGTEKCWDVVISPVGKPGEPVVQIVSVSRDITEQKKSEEALRKSAERLQGGIALTGIALADIDYTTNIATLSAEAAQMYGFPMGILSVTHKQLHDTFHPDCKRKLEKLVEELKKPDGNGWMKVEHRILLSGGEVRWLKINKQIFFDRTAKPAKPLYSLLAAQDITTKKEIEEAKEKLASHLKLATDAASIGIWSLNIKTQKLDWSDLHKKMWGFVTHQKDLTYADWHRAILAEDKAMVLQKIEESKQNKSIYEAEYRINRTDDDAVIWIKSTGQYYYDELGIAHTLTGISINITEQKRIEEELFVAKSKAENDKEIAEHAVMSKQQFLSNMSHEIRTPMNAIIGFTNVLMKTELNEKQKEYLQAIKSSGHNLVVLIDDILDLAKVDAGKLKFMNSPFKISECITSTLQLFETKMLESNLSFIKEYDVGIPEIILGDSVRLQQILVNLLSNAIKFTAKGKITLSANIISQDNEKLTLEIKVIDTGIGIPQNKLSVIFENFEQAHSKTSSLYGGTGLGLAIVKQLIEKQGGTISVKSKVDEGSTFSFTLSFQKYQTDLQSFQEEEIEEVDHGLKEIKILVVEDDKINQLLMKIILDNFKFKYDFAVNGKIAIEKLQTNAYDIILMDLQMPVMNGFEATEHIRKIMNLPIPIIATTADVTTINLEKCKALGMDDYISKPLDVKVLHRKIVDLMKLK